jgi:hypothetical protein
MVYLDPNNPGAAFADVQSNPATKKLLRENLRVKSGGFAAALTGLGEPEIKGDIHPDKYSKAIAQLLSPTEWEEELKWAQEDVWRLFHTPEVWKQVEEMVDDLMSRPEMIRVKFGMLRL